MKIKWRLKLKEIPQQDIKFLKLRNKQRKNGAAAVVCC